MMQWIHLIQNRREERRDNPDVGGPFIPEKEFLLVHSQSIEANPSSALLAQEDVPPDHKASFKAWVGNSTLFSFKDPDSLHPKIMIDHSKWPGHKISLGRPPDPPKDFHLTRPKYIHSPQPLAG